MTVSGLPIEQYLGDCYRFSWPEGISMELDRFGDGHRGDGLGCEITVNSLLPPSPGLLHQARFNLTSSSARATLTRALAARVDGCDFAGMLEQACFLSIKRWREGDPIINLWEVEDRPTGRWLIEPWVELGGPTTLFGDGGSGKSAFALDIALSVSSGIRTVGEIPTQTGPILYLDWETDRYEHAGRLRRLASGLDAIGAQRNPVHYRRQSAGLIDSIMHLKKMVAQLGVVFVIVDSLGAARGGEPESAELTIRTFNAVREFGVPVLFIDHQAKNAQDKTKPFGSVYTWNLSRIVWSAAREKTETDGSVLLGLTNHKANNGRVGMKRGYRMTWGDVIRFDSVAAREVPVLVKSMSNRDKLVAAIQQSPRGRMTVSDIEVTLEGMDAKLTANAIKSTLSLYRDGHDANPSFVQLPGGEWGLVALHIMDYGSSR